MAFVGGRVVQRLALSPSLQQGSGFEPTGLLGLCRDFNALSMPV